MTVLFFMFLSFFAVADENKVQPPKKISRGALERELRQGGTVEVVEAIKFSAAKGKLMAPIGGGRLKALHGLGVCELIVESIASSAPALQLMRGTKFVVDNPASMASDWEKEEYYKWDWKKGSADFSNPKVQGRKLIFHLSSVNLKPRRTMMMVCPSGAPEVGPEDLPELKFFTEKQKIEVWQPLPADSMK